MPAAVTGCGCVCVCWSRVIKVAKDYVGEMSFAVSSRTEMAAELQQFGLDTGDDVIVGLFDKKGQKYAMTTPFRYCVERVLATSVRTCHCSVDNLREFVGQFLGGELEPYIKSEPLPDDDTGHVRVSHRA